MQTVQGADWFSVTGGQNSAPAAGVDVPSVTGGANDDTVIVHYIYGGQNPAPAAA